MKHRYGKNVLITGGSSGIGRCTAELYAARGYKVFAASRKPKEKIETTDCGGKIYPLEMDVCDEDSVARGVAAVVDELGSIDILIHCAGFGIAGAAADTSNAAAHRQMETNYFGVLNVNRAVLPYMCERKSGLVIMVGSVAGLIPIPYQSHYSSSKYAIEAYASILRMELVQMNIRVTIVEPGDTRTGFTTARDFEIDESSMFYQDCIEAVGKMEQDEHGGDPPVKVARRILLLAGRKNPPLHNVIGITYRFFVMLKRLLPSRLILFILRKKYLLK